MKKLFTLLVASIATLGGFSQTVDYTFNWATSIEGTVAQAANVIGVKKAADGNYLTALVWGGTTAAGKTISWGGQNLQDESGADIEGADYSSGNSYTPNLLFTKVDPATGEPIWKLYTNFGYITNSNCDFQPTSDGGAILLMYGRQSDRADYRFAHIVSSDGTVTYLQHSDADKWSYRAALVKVNSDGVVEWTRTINALNETTDGTSVSTPFYTYSIALDADGNIYVAGRMCTTMYFLGKAGRIVPVEAYYNDGWDGDSQVTVGNAFIAKFTSDGYYTGICTANDGNYTYTQYDKLVVDGNTLYAFGTLKKSAEGALLQPSFSVIDLSTFTRTSYKEYTVAKNSGDRQNFKIYSAGILDGCFYVCGNLAGSITDNNVTIAATGTSSPLDGYIARFDMNGSLLSGLNYGTLNTGIEGAVLKGDKIIALAYQMSGAGAVALVYDKALTKEEQRTTLMTSGTTATAAAPLLDGDNFVVLSRGGKTASAFYGTTEVKPQLKQSFGVFFGSWKIGTTSGINNIAVDSETEKTVYSINGMKMPESYNPSKGIYIINGKKTILK